MGAGALVKADFLSQKCTPGICRGKQGNVTWILEAPQGVTVPHGGAHLGPVSVYNTKHATLSLSDNISRRNVIFIDENLFLQCFF